MNLTRLAMLCILLILLASVFSTTVTAQEKMILQPAGTVSWGDIVRYDATHSTSPASPRMIPEPMPGPDPQAITEGGVIQNRPPRTRDNKKNDMENYFTPQDATHTAAPPSLTFQAIYDNSTYIPPDTHGAVGPSHVMTMLNSQTRIQNKSGTITSTVTTAAFWTSGTGLSGSVFDPKILFDPISNRWIATIAVDAVSSTSRIFLAVSSTSDPTGTWTFFSIDADAANTTWADFPAVGLNGTWIAITSNMFTVSSGLFQGVKMWVIDKSTALSGGPLTVTTFATRFDLIGGVSGFTLQPCQALDTSSVLYLVDNSGWYRMSDTTFLIRITRITGTGSSPSFSVLPGSSFGSTGLFPVVNNFNAAQADAPQLGAGDTANIETNDYRYLNAVYRNGMIWCAHSAGLPAKVAPTPNRTASFWYQIDPSATPNPIAQSGVIDGGTGVHYFFPSISANSRNDMCIGFSRCDASRYAEGVVTGRLSTDPPGTVKLIELIKSGESPYSKFYGGTRNRWGDYSATVVDPSDNITFWSIQEYAGTKVGSGKNSGMWGTWWARVEPDVVLPIQLASLSASVVNGNNVRIEWSTISETNNYGFFVERRRSTETEFSTLENAFVPGNGTTLEPSAYAWTDEHASPGVYYYRLRQVDMNGSVTYSYTITVTVEGVLSVGDGKTAPHSFELGQNYPNPFNPSTSIGFSIAEAGWVTLRVYNSLGQEVDVLTDNHREPGTYVIHWDGKALPSGVYTYQLTSSTRSGVENHISTSTKKMLLLR